MSSSVADAQPETAGPGRSKHWRQRGCGSCAAVARLRSPARQRTRPRRRTAKERSEAEGFPPAGELVERVVEAVRSEPGKTVGEYAAILGVAPTSLYRPVRELTDDRKIVKRARQLFPE